MHFHPELKRIRRVYQTAVSGSETYDSHTPTLWRKPVSTINTSSASYQTELRPNEVTSAVSDALSSATTTVTDAVSSAASSVGDAASSVGSSISDTASSIATYVTLGAMGTKSLLDTKA